MTTEIEAGLRRLKSQIESLQQRRDLAAAKAEVAQQQVDSGMQRLKDEYGVESLDAAEQTLQKDRQEIEVSLQELLAQVEELEQ